MKVAHGQVNGHGSVEITHGLMDMVQWRLHMVRLVDMVQ